MDVKWFRLFSGLTALAGGWIWIRYGIELASLPARMPGVSYRGSATYMPWFGIGMICVAIGLLGLYFTIESKRRWQSWKNGTVLTGSVLYGSGTLFRLSTEGGWEPALPVGFMLVAAGLMIVGVTVIRSRSLPLWCGLLILFSAVSLLFFNDQYVTAWASVPFGLSWAAIGIYLAGNFRVNPSATGGMEP